VIEFTITDGANHASRVDSQLLTSRSRRAAAILVSRFFKMKHVRLGAFALVALLSVSACSISARRVLAPSLAATCRSTDSGPTVQWFSPADIDNRSRLDRVCAGVGPILFEQSPAVRDASLPSLQDVAFVSWNVHVGAADVQRFVRDLEAGRVTAGHKPAHVVLMLQEAVRGEGVPALLPAGASAARRIGSAGRPGDDSVIEAIARELRMSVFYAPSMRNGGVSADYAATDRGNAILSTLPLSGPAAIELPGERQRRVAITAAVPVRIGGEAIELRIGAAHLDNMGRWRRLWLLGAPTLRAEQSRSLMAAVPSNGPVIFGADLNSWLGPSEPAPRALARFFRDTPTGRRTGTFLGGLVLDYMFFRSPAGWRAHFDRVPDRYGSDHYPLVGWLES
jgi:endonuclease/exonuclease/phosphatase family metal-dependent hydrolase